VKTIEVTFAFEIGEEVVCGTAWRLALRTNEQYRTTHEARNGYVPKPTICVPVFQVVERIAQECPGGVQRLYVCRGYIADKYGDGAAHISEQCKFLEHELMALPALPALASPPISDAGDSK
jgi:hypothetical protein